MNLIDLLTIIALALSAIAVAFAVIQLRDGARQLRKLESTSLGVEESLSKFGVVLAELDRVARALPTRTLGLFPSYLPELRRLIERTESTLTMVTDHPAYGCYSDPAEHQAYLRAIERKMVDGVRVRVLHLREQQRLELNEGFCSPEDAWPTEERARVEAFLSNHNQPPATLGQTRASFLSLIESLNKRVVADFDAAARVGNKHSAQQVFQRYETPLPIPICLWVSDGVEAIFAIGSFAEGLKEVGFLTIDPELIKALEGVFDRFVNEPSSSPDLSESK